MREKWVKHAYRPATYTYHVPGGFRPTDVPAQNALRFESDPSTIIRTAASIAAHFVPFIMCTYFAPTKT